MTPTGRNDPCPCGSGKKYKKCCLETAELSEFTWLKMRRTEGELIPRLLKHAADRYGPDSVYEAWDEFSLWQDIPIEPESEPELETAFLPWFVFNWQPDNAEKEKAEHYPEIQVARHYLVENEEEVEPFTRRFIEGACATQYSFFMVMDRESGKTLTLRDLLLKQETTVIERRASTSLRQGDILFSRIVTLDDTSIMLGCAPLTIPVSYADVFIDFRENIVNNFPQMGDDIPYQYDLELRKFYFDIKEQLYNPSPPRINNTDGEEMQPTTLYYSLACTPREAFDALKTLSLAEDDDELLAEAGFDERGQLQSIELPWLKERNKLHGEQDYTLMANLVIDGESLTVEVNSRERVEAIRRKISRRLGKRAIFKNALIQSMEKILEDAAGRPPVGPPADDDINDLPEVQEKLKEMAGQHWAVWLDEPVPALKDMTPRQAASTPVGRERLEALLMEFNQRNAYYDEPRPAFLPDVDALRQSLGLNEELPDQTEPAPASEKPDRGGLIARIGADRLAGMVRESLGPEFVKICEKLGVDVEGAVRYKPFGDKFEAARLGRNLTTKEAAAQIKSAQYRLRAIENGHFSEILPDVLRKYASFLHLEDYVTSWSQINPNLADDLGIDRSPSPGSGMVFQFKITLRGTKPPVWRRIQVPGEYSFWALHVAIQDAMGWLDYHLHQFDILDFGSRRIEHIGFPDDEFLLEQVVLPGWEVPIARLFTKAKQKTGYLYDFGDDWQQTVLLEKIIPPEAGATYPRCTGGSRKCPPEDCGGTGGYGDFLEIIADPADVEHQSTLEWVGGSYDPDDFNPTAVHFDDPAARFLYAFSEES
ncbi:MAG: IS1096 element passenger TnpR family protein [Thermoleophilia bacterium]